VLQLDPNSGAILRKIEVGNQPHRLVLARNRGLWVGLNGEGKIRRIDLIDFSVGQKFELGLAATTPIRDIAPSHVDEDTFAFSAGGRTSLVKDGVLLPDSVVMGSSDNITTLNGITMLEVRNPGPVFATVILCSVIFPDPDNLGRETLLPVEDTFKRSTMQLAILGTNATALAYDPVTDRMFQGDTTGRLWEVDFKNMNLRLVNHWQLTQGIRDTRVVLENRGLWVTVAGWDLVTRLDLDTLAIGPAIPTMTTVRDLAGSPTQPGLVAYASPDRVGVAGGGSPQGSNWVQGSGEIEFSSDGTKIYQLADLDCSLRILNLTATNLSRGATYHDMPCDSFQHSDGWLYFNNGLVFDPDKGQTVTNLNLRSPAFMLPDSSDRLHILTKTNGRWVVRTLNKKTFTELNRFDLPLEFSNYTFRKGTAMGTAKVGVVAASGEVIVVNLQSGELRLGAERINGQVELAFATGAGERYQLQETATIASPQWQNVGVEIVGTGSVEKRAFTTAGIEKYYRLVRLP
jgi:hypothetical protein